MKEINIIAVDFDGTLCSECYPNIGRPNLPLINQLIALRQEGKRVILWTCRCGDELANAVEWCKKFGLEFDAVNENVPEILELYGSESRKVSADVYIDDKHLHPQVTKCAGTLPIGSKKSRLSAMPRNFGISFTKELSEHVTMQSKKSRRTALHRNFSIPYGC